MKEYKAKHPMLTDILGHYLIKNLNVAEPVNIKLSVERGDIGMGIPQLLINVPLTAGCFKVSYIVVQQAKKKWAIFYRLEILLRELMLIM